MAYDIRKEAEQATRIVADAGGEVVGRTRLQKIAYMLEALGLGEGFCFKYKHYGPYSDDLSSALRFAVIFDMAKEDERVASWGGSYSIFSSCGSVEPSKDSIRHAVIAIGNSADPINLELAATAVLLAEEGFTDPWSETKSRKPEKANDQRLSDAKDLIAKFKQYDLQHRLKV